MFMFFPSFLTLETALRSGGKASYVWPPGRGASEGYSGDRPYVSAAQWTWHRAGALQAAGGQPEGPLAGCVCSDWAEAARTWPSEQADAGLQTKLGLAHPLDSRCQAEAGQAPWYAHWQQSPSRAADPGEGIYPSIHPSVGQSEMQGFN